jgi:hypothetical protein
MNSDSHGGVLELDHECSWAPTADGRSQSGNLPGAHRHFQFAFRHAAWIALCVSIAGLLAAVGWPLFTGQVYTADDLGWFHLPMRAFYAQQLARGESFDWCPDMFCGFYLTGEGQVGSYHPLHWLLYRTLPLPIPFDLECWLSYPFMLLGMYLFLRRWQLRREGAAFGALAFTFGSFNLLHLIHVNGVAIVAHLPWLLLAIDIMLRTSNSEPGEKTSLQKKRLAFCAVALLTGSQLLLGYPQYVFFSFIVEAGYVLILNRMTNAASTTAVRGFIGWGLAVALGGLLGGVQLVPTLDALQHSVRQSSATQNFATQGSLPPLNWMQLVTPYLFATRVVGGITHEFALYLGAAPFVLAVWWICHRKRYPQYRALSVAAMTTAALALFWTIGDFGPLGWLQEHLPLVNKFRLPSRAIVVFQLAMATLAALGFSALLGIVRDTNRPEETAFLSEPPTNNTKWIWTLPALSVAFTLLALACWNEYLPPYPWIVVGPAMTALAVWLVLRAANGARWAAVVLVILSATDLGLYGISYSVYGHVEPLSQFIAGIDVPPGTPLHRVVLDLASGTEAAPGQKIVRTGDQILLRGWQRTDGYAGLDPAKQLNYSDPAALRAAGVQWIASNAAVQIENSYPDEHLLKVDSENSASHQQASLINPNTEDAKTDWYRLSNPQSKAWLVTRTIFSDKPAADLGHISLSHEALVDTGTSPLSQNPPLEVNPEPSAIVAKPQGTVGILADKPGDLSFSVDTSTPQLLVINESYHPGWQATVDHQPAAVLRADGDFMGVVVEPGTHEIALKFQPKSLEIGRLLSGCGLSLLVVLVVAAGWPEHCRDH